MEFSETFYKPSLGHTKGPRPHAKFHQNWWAGFREIRCQDTDGHSFIIIRIFQVQYHKKWLSIGNFSSHHHGFCMGRLRSGHIGAFKVNSVLATLWKIFGQMWFKSAK